MSPEADSCDHNILWHANRHERAGRRERELEGASLKDATLRLFSDTVIFSVVISSGNSNTHCLDLRVRLDNPLEFPPVEQRGSSASNGRT